MNTIPIKSIKPWFIGIIAALTLLAGSAPAEGLPLIPSISPSQLTCSQTKTAGSNTITFTAEVVIEDEFCAGLSAGPLECTGFSYSLKAEAGGNTFIIDIASLSVSTVLAVQSSTANIRFGAPGAGGSGLFELRIATFQNPENLGTLLGTVVTDNVEEPGTVTLQAVVPVGKKRKLIFDCAILGPSGIPNVVSETTETTTSCLQRGGFVSAIARRNAQGDVEDFPNGFEFFVGAEFPCKPGVDKAGLPQDPAGFIGLELVSKGVISEMGKLKREVAFSRRGDNTPEVFEFVKKNGKIITICVDAELHGFKAPDPDFTFEKPGDNAPNPDSDELLACDAPDPVGDFKAPAGCKYFCNTGTCDGFPKDYVDINGPQEGKGYTCIP